MITRTCRAPRSTPLTSPCTARNPLAALTIAVLLASASPLSAATKANNATPLTQPASWVNSIAPSTVDPALFNNTLTTALTTTLGANLSWLGLQVTNPAGPITINADGNTLSLGSGGMDLSTSTQNLTLYNNLSLTAPQTWKSGVRFIALYGNINNNGNTLSFTNSFSGTLTGAATVYGAISGAGQISALVMDTVRQMLGGLLGQESAVPQSSPLQDPAFRFPPAR